jgi:hypothetical protein
MGIAKRTAHATEATISAIVDAQDEEGKLSGIPANYFEHRADQLEKAVNELAAKKIEADRKYASDKLALNKQLEDEKREMLVQWEVQKNARLGVLRQSHADEIAAIEQERDDLRKQSRDFRHQAAMYDRNKLRCSYLDCLRGKASVPKERAGMLLFQALMIGGMVSIMTTFNGFRYSGFDFFVNNHWMYPFTFCLTFLIREWFMNDFTEAIIHQFILPRFKGVRKATLITLTNIVCMVPLMSTIMTCMIYGVHDLGATLLEQVPITIVVGACVNFFIVSPIVKMIYNNLIVANASGENGAYNKFHEMIMPLLSAFSS